MNKLLMFGLLAISTVSVAPLAAAEVYYYDDGWRVGMHVDDEDFGDVWSNAAAYVEPYRAAVDLYGYTYDRSDWSLAGEMRAHIVGNWVGRSDNDFGLSPSVNCYACYERAFPLLGWW